MRRVLAGLIMALFYLQACASDTEDVSELTVLPCSPGERRACICEAGGRGVQTCAINGSGFGACSECSTNCSRFPDCGGCVECLETCLCQSDGDQSGCASRCADQPSGSGGSGGSGSESCDVAACPDAGFAQIAEKCCTANNACGFSVQMLGGGCIEGGQEGNPDSSCPAFQVPGIGISLSGCCRPTGICGVNDTFVGFGCVDPADFGGAPSTQTCN
jgi:hypothetical protein